MAVQPFKITPQIRLSGWNCKKPWIAARTDKRRASGIYDENDGTFCLLGKLEGARARARKPEPVVVAHHALDDGKLAAAAVFREQVAQRVDRQRKRDRDSNFSRR